MPLAAAERTTNQNATCSWRIGVAAMSLAGPLMLASLTGANALAQEAAPPRVVVPTDRSVLPIPEPKYPIALYSMPGTLHRRHGLRWRPHPVRAQAALNQVSLWCDTAAETSDLALRSLERDGHLAGRSQSMIFTSKDIHD
jgi:hypothetical protein